MSQTFEIDNSIRIFSPEDSGNCHLVQKTELNHAVKHALDNHNAYKWGGLSSIFVAKTDYDFIITTRPDSNFTIYENRCSTWFYFVLESKELFGKSFRFTIANMNYQTRLYDQGYSPVYTFEDENFNMKGWKRLASRISWFVVNNRFYITFIIKCEYPSACKYHFAFAYPWTYQECCSQLDKLQLVYKKDADSCKVSDIYFHRDLLINSLDNRKVELITISDHYGILKESEPQLDPILFPNDDQEKARSFNRSLKQVFFVSSRVHPGETPASHAFNGLLELLLRENDPRAIALRRKFVFKLIPILNPDGVYRGHYRTDSRGVNLNRYYLKPDPFKHPSIYAAKSLLAFYQSKGNFSFNSSKTNGTIQDLIRLQLKIVKKIIQALKSSSVSFTPNNQNVTKLLLDLLDSCEEECKEAYSSLFILKQNTKWNMSNFQGVKNILLNISDKWHKNKSKGIIDQSDLDSDSEAEFFQKKAFSLDVLNYESDLTWMSQVFPEDLVLAFVDLLPEYKDFNLWRDGSHFKDFAVSHDQNGIAYYIDMHGHCSKRGCFFYGNSHSDQKSMEAIIRYATLVSVNSPIFDYKACNFSRRNMFAKDRNRLTDKSGTGRVSMLTQFNILHSYTLECNYNTISRNSIIPLGDCKNSESDGRITPRDSFKSRIRNFSVLTACESPDIDDESFTTFSTKSNIFLSKRFGIVSFTPEHFQSVGRALLYAALDMDKENIWTRLNYGQQILRNTKDFGSRKSISAQQPYRMDKLVETTHRLARSFVAKSSEDSSNNKFKGNVYLFDKRIPQKERMGLPKIQPIKIETGLDNMNDVNNSPKIFQNEATYDSQMEKSSKPLTKPIPIPLIKKRYNVKLTTPEKSVEPKKGTKRRKSLVNEFKKINI